MQSTIRPSGCKFHFRANGLALIGHMPGFAQEALENLPFLGIRPTFWADGFESMNHSLPVRAFSRAAILFSSSVRPSRSSLRRSSKAFATDLKRKLSRFMNQLIPSAISVAAARAEKNCQALRFFQKSHIKMSCTDFFALAIKTIALATARIHFHVRGIFTSSPASFAKGADGESAPFVRLYHLVAIPKHGVDSKFVNGAD